MCGEIIAIRIELRPWIAGNPFPNALIHIPIRRIDGYVAHVILVLFEKAPEAVTFFGCVSFLEKQIAEQPRALPVGRNDRLIAEEICREFTVRNRAVREHPQTNWRPSYFSGLG